MIEVDICIVNHGFDMGGVERVATLLANSFQKNGEKVTLVDFTGNNTFYYEVNNEIEIPKVIRPRTTKRKIYKIIFYLKYLLNKKPIDIKDLYREQAQDLIRYLKSSEHDTLILCQGTLTALAPLIKKEIPNIKIVAWQHNDFDVYTKKYFVKFLNDYLKGLRKSDVVVCLTKSDLEKYKEINKNTCNIYNPLTLVTSEISKLNEKNIVFAGRLLMEQKGLDYLISIGKELEPGWKILVAGDGKDRKKFERMISDNKLEGRIILKGSLTSNELIELYIRGSIFISTSRWEGFGLVITEAMAAGLPVISFKNLGPNEILNYGEYGILIENDNVSELISKLKILMGSEELRSEFQLKSLERVKEFKTDNILKQWYKILNTSN